MKRTLAFLLCFVMLFSLAMPFGVMAEETAAIAEEATVATTEFSDVPSDSPYKEAISTLTGLGIILGDAGANTFRPEAGITRAEFCVIVARLKNMGSLNVPAETAFTDVTTALCDEWKVKAVRIASDLQIVAGMGDGTFAPDASVTYEQAVKMLVCLLKYEPMAKGLGGWPTGYIAAGAQIGLTKKAFSIGSEPAPRQIIAQLVYNALEIPEMSIKTEGVVSGGSTLMNDSLKYKEATGIVTSTYEMSLQEDNPILKEGQIQIDYKTIYNVGSSGANKYLGKEIEFLYSDDTTISTIQSCKLTDSNSESSFKSDEIKSISQSEIQIYTDDNYNKYDSYLVEPSVKLVYNGYAASASYLNNSYKPSNGSIKLIDNNSNNSIDVIIMNHAEPFVVDRLDTTEKKLYNVYDDPNDIYDVIDLAEASNKKIKITKGSATVSFSSIAKNSVLLVSKSLNTSGTQHINVEIISNTKTGVIKSMSADDRTITIGSDTYEVSDLCWNKYSSKFQMDNSVTIYFDNQKKVLYVVENAAAASSYSYGYLINMKKDGSNGSLSSGQVEARIFTQNGTIQTYPFAEKVKYYGYNPAATDGSSYSGDLKSPDEVFDLLVTTGRTDINKDPGAVNSVNAQVVKYSLNSKGQINAIFTSVPKAAGLEITSNLILSDSGSGLYRPSAKKLGNSLVKDTTKIYFIPTDRNVTDDYAVGNVKSLAADIKNYKYEAYDTTDGYAKVIFVFGDTSIPVSYRTNPTVIVSKIQEINTENGAAHKFFVNASTTAYTTESLSVLSGVKVGDVIKLKLGKKDVVEEVLKLYSPADSWLYPFDNGAAERLAATSNNDITLAKKTTSFENHPFGIMYGTIYEKFTDTFSIRLADVVVEKDAEGNIVNTTLDPTEEFAVSFTSSTKVYLYSKSKGEVTLDTSEGGKIQDFVSARHNASNIYLMMNEGRPTFAIVVTE